MKTFSEAYRDFLKPFQVEGDNPEELHKQASELNRCLPVSQEEITADQEVYMRLETAALQVVLKTITGGSPSQSILEALIVHFRIGIAVGVAMERQELTIPPTPEEVTH